MLGSPVVSQEVQPSVPPPAETVAPSTDPVDRDPRVAWLDEHAVRIRSVFRGARDVEGQWLRERLGLRARGYGEDFLEDWPRGFDAALYIHEMTPATWHEDFVREIKERLREIEEEREEEEEDG